MQLCENNVGICMHVTSKHHAVTLHFTCMGTSRISGVSARHGFEQAVFLIRLSTMIIRVYPIKIYHRVVHSFIGVCPMKNIGGWSNILSDSFQ